MNKKIVIAIVTVFLIGLFALPAMAQSPVRAEVDRTDITSDDVLILSIIIEDANGNATEPQFEGIDGFAARGKSSSTQLSIINGQRSRQTIYQYSLIPTQLGTLTVPAAHVTVDGNAYVTDPIYVNVTQGNGQPTGNGQTGAAGAMPSLSSLLSGMGGAMGGNVAASSGRDATINPAQAPAELTGQPFYIEAVVDNDNPYQGEQVLYTFRFYQAENLYDQPIYSPAEFTGFWSVEVDGQTEHRVEAAGQSYLVTQIQTALFPTVVGELTIEPSELSIPSDFFSQGMSMETQPIALTVKPLPADAPDGFMGAVGRFMVQTATSTQLSTGVSQEAITLNDSVDWLVRLSGEGNIEQLPAPIWPEGDEWQAIDSEPTIDSEFAADRLLGSAVYERVMIPTTLGELELPAVEYVYFNPETEVYETAVSEAHIIKVTGSVPAATTAQPMSGNDGQPVVDNGLRPIKPATEITGSSAAPLTEKTGYWLLWLVPLFVLGGTVGAKRYQNHHHAGADDRRKQHAAQEATTALTQTDGSVGQILSDYISTKLGQSVTGMTQTAVIDLLHQHGVDDTLAARVQSCLQQSEAAQYAPADLHGSDDLRAETVAVIQALEEALV